jgi:hypothetical protein
MGSKPLTLAVVVVVLAAGFIARSIYEQTNTPALAQKGGRLRNLQLSSRGTSGTT